MLKIVSTPSPIYRNGRLRRITCYHVIENATGEMIYGGHVQGCPKRSGWPRLPSYEAAFAWKQGWLAAAEREVVHPKTFGVKVDPGGYEQYGIPTEASPEAQAQREMFCLGANARISEQTAA